MIRETFGITSDCALRDDVRAAMDRLKRRGVRVLSVNAVVDEMRRACSDPMYMPPKAMAAAWAAMEVGRAYETGDPDD